MLAVEVIVELESADDAEADHAALADCAVGEFAEVEVTTVEVGPPTSVEQATEPEGDPVGGVGPRAAQLADRRGRLPERLQRGQCQRRRSHDHRHVSGIDMGVSWEPLAAGITWQLLETART